jgi:hypothetical protein
MAGQHWKETSWSQLGQPAQDSDQVNMDKTVTQDRKAKYHGLDRKELKGTKIQENIDKDARQNKTNVSPWKRK